MAAALRLAGDGKRSRAGRLHITYDLPVILGSV